MNGAPLITTPPADGDANEAMQRVAAVQRAYNGATFDLWRNNAEFTILPSAARTVQTNSADLINHNARGAIVFLNVTNASGTGGLQIRWQFKDPLSGNYDYFNSAPTAIIATGLRSYILYPTAIAVGTQAVNCMLPRTWRIQVQVGDASSYTYSLSGCYIN